MGEFVKNELAEKRGYTYRLTRRQFLVASSAAALAACGPAAVTPSASPSASPGKELKIGVLLPFTGVYAELGNSMRRATELYLNQNDRKVANRPVTLVYGDDANVIATGVQVTQKFIDQDQVDVMMGVVPTPLAYGIRNAVHAAKLIFIDTNAGGNALTRDTTNCTPSCKSHTSSVRPSPRTRSRIPSATTSPRRARRTGSSPTRTTASGPSRRPTSRPASRRTVAP